jgi:DNA repair exonuclease SbcCD ATPase subunit
VLQSIRLQNFQSHQETTIDFDKGITVLTGVSSAGKSAIMRAFGWVDENRPLGNEFISYWNRKADGSPVEASSVQVVADNGEVTRIKTGKLNGYTVKGEPLSTVGTDVPDDVFNVLRMSDLNVARQLDPHFMLSLSPGEVARYLNKLVNLDKIDEVLAKADSEQRETKRTAETLKKEIDESTTVVESLTWVDSAEALLQKVDALRQAYDKAQTKRFELLRLIVKHDESTYEVTQFKPILEKATKMSETIDKCGKLYTLADSKRKQLELSITTITDADVVLTKKPLLSKVSSIMKNIDTLYTTMATKRSSVFVPLTSLVDTLQSVESLVRFRPVVEKTSTLIEARTQLVTCFSTLQAKSCALQNLIDTVVESTKAIRTLVIDVEDAKAELPNVCPTCGRPMEGDVCA